MLSLDKIDQVLQGSGPSSTSDRQLRAQSLHDVLATLQQHVYSGSHEAVLIVQKLGDASRTEPWRLPLGDAGILDFALNLLRADGTIQPLKMHSLRLIGNSCADTNENRDRLLASNGLNPIINQISDDGVLPFAIQVLYNVIVDHEPAQLAASSAGLGYQLINLVSGPRLADCRNLISIICNMLELIVAQEPEANVAHPQAPIVLLNLSNDPDATSDLADYLMLISLALAYLAFPTPQTTFIEAGHVPALIDAYYVFVTRQDLASDSEGELAALVDKARRAFSQVLADVCCAPSFARSHPLGSPVLQTLQRWLGEDFHSYPAVQATACLCLGNIARSDEASVTLVGVYQVHEPVMAMLSSQLGDEQAPAAPAPLDAHIVHGALSLLKNLAIPASNKPLLSPLLAPPLLPRIWALDPNGSMTVPHLHYLSVSLARLLISSTPQNVRLLVSPLPSAETQQDENTAQPQTETETETQTKTHLHRILGLFLHADPESAGHTKTEAARVALAVVRALHASGPVSPVLPDDWDPDTDQYVYEYRPERQGGAAAGPAGQGVGASSRREKFYRLHDVLPAALAYLVTQPKFPVLRSEAWFVFALASRSREGASLVVRALGNTGAWEALVESVTGQKGAGAGAGANEDDVSMTSPDSTFGGGTGGAESSSSAAAMVDDLGLQPQQADPQQAAGMARVDRENGLVLVSELAKHCGDEVPGEWSAAVEAMLKEGGELVLGDRNSDSSDESGGAGGGKGLGVA